MHHKKCFVIDRSVDGKGVVETAINSTKSNYCDNIQLFEQTFL